MKLEKEKKEVGKKIIVISTSLRKGSNSDTLADEFIRGTGLMETGDVKHKVKLLAEAFEMSKAI